MAGERVRLWALDKTAHYAERAGDVLSAPWYRLSRWAADAWFRGRR